MRDDMLVFVVVVVGLGIFAYIFGYINLPLFAILNSPLHVEGNKLVDGFGNEVVLRGLTYIDQGHVSRVGLVEQDFQVASNDWNANVMRMPVHPDTFYGNEDYYFENYLDVQVDMAEKYGMYASIDYHAYDELNLGDLERFWSVVAPRYSDRSHVLYEVMNEPTQGDWLGWRDNVEVITDLIRSYDDDAVIIMNGLDWGYDISGALANPVRRDNIVYGTHPYPNKFWVCGDADTCTLEEKRSTWDSHFGDVKDVYPVIATEFGWDYSNNVWGYGTNLNYGEPILSYFDEKNIGYFAWHWSDSYGPALMSDWNNYVPSTSGELIKSHLNSFSGPFGVGDDTTSTTTISGDATTTTVITTTTVGDVVGGEENWFSTFLNRVVEIINSIVERVLSWVG